MERMMAESLATAIGGVATGPMPESQAWAVGFVRPDGKFASIEDHGVYLFASKQSYDALVRGDDYDVSPVIDGAEWDHWGSYQWCERLATLIGGVSHQTGGRTMVIGLDRADGMFVAIAADCAIVYRRRSDWESGKYDCGEFIHEFQIIN